MKYVAFLRAINVGGRTVTMARLRGVFESAGMANVTTFIASGNVLFDSRSTNAGALERRAEAALESALGFAVDTMVRTRAEVADAATFEAFGPRHKTADPVTDYVAFLKSAPDGPAIDRLMAQASEADALHVRGRELYWQRRSQAASKFSGSTLERALGIPATVRNRNTVQKLAIL